MPEQPPQPAEENAETMDILSTLFQEWKRDHPGGTLRDFYAAVAAGEVKIPG